MEALELVGSLAPTATIRSVGGGANQVFRVMEEASSTSIVKVYSSPARERRERHALEALAGTRGIPAIVDRGLTEGVAWIRMTDGGAWDLRTLPNNLDAVRNAGAVLQRVHASRGSITNLEEGFDDAYVESHYRSTIERLGRYRRKLQIPATALEAASRADGPHSSPPGTAHTRPTLGKFLVDEQGEITLIDWEWATRAPPEWDVSLAIWQIGSVFGAGGAAAFRQGYGDVMSDERLRPWVVYHAAMLLLDGAESRDGRLGDLDQHVQVLVDSIEV